jgi:hypothetical protein
MPYFFLLSRIDHLWEMVLKNWLAPKFQRRCLVAYLAEGDTTVRSLGYIIDAPGDILHLLHHIASGHLRSPRLFIVGPVFTTPDRHPVGTMARGNTQLQEKIAGQVTDPEITRVADHREGIVHLNVIVSAFRSLFAIILGNSS